MHDVRECKINFLVHPSPWANLRLGASDSRLYYFLSKLTGKLFCAAARRMAEEGKQASFDYATASLAGRHPDSKAGMVAITMLWIFGALTLGWVVYAIGRGPGRKQLNPASAGVSRLTAAPV